jgi:formylglycine-generating enzyme required for sulfatase activity
MMILWLPVLTEAQPAVRCSGPLSEAQLTALLKGAVPAPRIRQNVASCGIDFEADGEAINRLRSAGMPQTVLDAVRAATGPAERNSQAEQALWASIKDSQDPQSFEQFLREYPNGQHVGTARQKLVALNSVAPANLSLTFDPNPVPQGPDGSWTYVLTIRETAGVGFTITRVNIGGYDQSTQIASYFGTAHIPPGGKVSQRLGTRSYTPPADEYWQIGGYDDNGRRGITVSVAVHLVAALSVGRTTPTIAAGTKKVNPKDELTYVWIPPGWFMMGCSPEDNECSDTEKPTHEVTITKGFWLGQTPVTQQAYQRVTGQNPSNFKGPNLPVETLDWNEAKAYCVAIGGRLPTEAEWEYAARAGSSGPRYGNLDEIAWYWGNSRGQTHEVEQKLANAFGLLDMLGNVWQWTADWYGDYQSGAQSDPSGAVSGQYRALRGGSWFIYLRDVRVSVRDTFEPDGRNYDIGFRCVER